MMEAGVRSFVDHYGKIHGPLVIGLCLFGIATNVVNVIVLTRRYMIGSTNILLTGLSSAQLLLLVNYLAYSIYGIFDTACNMTTKSYGWLVYLLLNVNLNLVLHTIALVHTTMLAIFRYAAVAFPTRSKMLVSVRGARNAVIAAFIAVPVVCASFYPNSTIAERNLTRLMNSTKCPELVFNAEGYPTYGLRYTDRQILRDYNFWFFGTACKLLPCVLLVILSACLLYELSQVRRRRERLINQKSASKSERHHRQLTVMLVCIVLLFVAVELPQGAMNMLSAILKDRFINIYTSLGDFFEMLTVLYSGINFILYCSMSSQFRTTFKVIFLAPCLQFLGFRKWSDTCAMTNSKNRRLRKSTYSMETRNMTSALMIDTPV